MTKKEIANLFYDGFNSKLIEAAAFEGEYEIPVLKRCSELIFPKCGVPFSKMDYTYERDLLVFYEHDPEFRDLVSIPQKYIKKIKTFKCASTPDCSLYRDMPFSFQIANVAVARSIGLYMQNEGVLVYPNVRWGDERSYESKQGEKPLAFAGIPTHTIVTIGTYGCSKTAEDRYYLQAGLDAMLITIEPLAVIVYGSMSHKIFEPYIKATDFYHIPDWTSYKKGGK